MTKAGIRQVTILFVISMMFFSGVWWELFAAIKPQSNSDAMQGLLMATLFVMAAINAAVFTAIAWNVLVRRAERESNTELAAEGEAKLLGKQRIDCGRVERATVKRKGFFSIPVSEVVTTQGTYRVQGDVGHVDPGELASIRSGIFILGVVSEKRQYRFDVSDDKMINMKLSHKRLW